MNHFIDTYDLQQKTFTVDIEERNTPKIIIKRSDKDAHLKVPIKLNLEENDDVRASTTYGSIAPSNLVTFTPSKSDMEPQLQPCMNIFDMHNKTFATCTIKQICRKHPKGINKYTKIVCGSTCRLYKGHIIMMALIIVIALLTIAIGAKYKDQCPVEQNIPMYLIVLGVLTLVLMIIQVHFFIQKVFVKNKDTVQKGTFAAAKMIFILFLFAWFVTGQVWIFKQFQPQYQDKYARNYCHKILYWYGLGINLFICFIGFGILCISRQSYRA